MGHRHKSAAVRKRLVRRGKWRIKTKGGRWRSWVNGRRLQGREGVRSEGSL